MLRLSGPIRFRRTPARTCARRHASRLVAHLLLAACAILLAFPLRAAAQTGQITKAPKLTRFVEAVYPADKKAAGLTARVVLSIEIADDGKVGEVEVVQTGGADFDAAALAAAKQFVFEPAEVDGHPGPVKITYAYQFKIETQVVSLGPQINFEGVILERFKKHPFPGVTITIKEMNVSSTVGADGRFAFTDVPLGSHKVELTGKNLITVSTDETFEKDKKKTVKYYVEERDASVDEEVVVRATRIKKEAVETTIRTEEARKVPGTQGDTLKVVQDLPGVGRSSFGSGQLIVWGSAPGDTQVIVDGVSLPALYHIGGLRSTINQDFVKSIDLTPGSYGSEYGRGIGGLVRVETKDNDTTGVHGYLGADFIDASGMLSAQITPNLHVDVAGRQSYLDKTLPLVSKENIGEFVPIPRYDDYQARLALNLRTNEKLEAVFLASDDHFTQTIPSSDPAEVRSQTQDTSYKRFLLRYTRVTPDGATISVVPSFGYDVNNLVEQFGSIPAKVDSSTWTYSLRASYRARVAPWAVMTLGTDVQGQLFSNVREGSLTIPAREGDITIFGQAPGGAIFTDRWSNHIASAGEYLLLEITAGKLKVTPGLRFEPWLLQGSATAPAEYGQPVVGFSNLQLTLDPRLSASYAITSKVTVNVAGGIFHQAPDTQALSAVFGNPTLGLERAFHVNAGIQWKITSTLSFEAVGFFKWLDGLISRSESVSPQIGQALVQNEVGRIYGGQFLLRQELVKGFFGWITYTVSRSERKDHPDTTWRLFDDDQTHVLAILASYQLPFGLEAGVRFRFTSGLPYTPVLAAFYDATGDQYQPLFGLQNSQRLPPFLAFDVRLEKTFTWRRIKLNIYLDVQNVTNQANPEEVTYNYNYSKLYFITGLPILPVLGLRMEF
jgi:TonB family protein